MKLKGCFLHGSDDWSTPKEIYDCFINDGYIDPCPLHSDENCLLKQYNGCYLFINPPYSKLLDFSIWIIKQLQHDCSVVLLVPARTDTNWFHNLLPYASQIDFIKGRLKFGNSKTGAPFPSIIMYLQKGGAKDGESKKDAS